MTIRAWVWAWVKWLWQWLSQCDEPGCTKAPMALGYCEEHAKPYDHDDELWG